MKENLFKIIVYQNRERVDATIQMQAPSYIFHTRLEAGMNREDVIRLAVAELKVKLMSDVVNTEHSVEPYFGDKT